MAKLTIIHFSGAGHTEAIAREVGRGAELVEGISVEVLAIEGRDIVDGRYKNDGLIAGLGASDAIVFGSPTYMGGPAAQFKAFADATVGVWSEQKWRDKWAAGFTTSGAPSGDKFSTLQYLHTLAMQHGMVWVGTGEKPGQPDGVNRLGGWGGVMTQTDSEARADNPDPGDVLTARKLGRRVASFLTRNGKN